MLAVDASAWPRPDAATSPERLFCPVYGRTRESDQFLPGWPYRLVAALESGPTSGTALLGAVRLGPADEATAVTAARLRAVVDRLRTAGHWHVGERPMLVVLDAGYDWQAYLRRFDLDHTIRFEKQSLGWTRPKLRSPAAADRWTWLVLAAHTRLRLARPLAVDLRRPWERPLPPQRLTPARVRRGFRYLRAKAPCPASAPKPAHPGPGRPPGVSNRQGAIRYDVGKTTTQDTANKKNQQVRG